MSDDADLAAFFSGADLTAEPVEDGGKGLGPEAATPSLEAENGLSWEDYWAAAEIAAGST